MTARLAPTTALVAATAVWGSAFVVTKGSLALMSPASFLTWRFGVAAVALVLVRPRSVARLTRTEQRRAVLLGTILGAGFLLQTFGLVDTLAGVSGFLTGAAVIFTPVVAAAFFGEHVALSGWVGAGVATVGIAVLAGGVSAPSTVGSLLTLGGAACFAVHITGLSEWASHENAYGLTALSVAVAAGLSSLTALVTGGISAPTAPSAWQAVLYLGLIGTCAGLVVQAWAQSSLTATTAAVIMTMEPVFAAVLAFALGERGLGWLGWAGGLLVVASMFVTELGARQCCDALSPRVECC